MMDLDYGSAEALFDGDLAWIVEACGENREGPKLAVDVLVRKIVDAALANGERVEPDYEAARQAAKKRFGTDYPAFWVDVIVDAAIGDKLLIDPPTEED